MLSNSNLRNLDEPTQRQRQERTRKIVQKLQEANITSKNKPFIHTMYQNYHEKFCNRFKKKFMTEAQQIFDKKEGKNMSRELSNISKDFQNISEIKQNSDFHKSDMTNILNEIQDDKSQSNQSTSNIVPTEIRKIKFPSQVKTQKTGNQMKKKKNQEAVEVVSLQKNEPTKKEEIIYRSQVKEERKKSTEGFKETKQSPKQISNTISHPKHEEEVQRKEIKSPVQIKQRVQKEFAIKSDISSPKKEKQSENPVKNLPSPIKLINSHDAVKNKVEDQEQDYEQVQQDSTSYYQQRLKHIDEVKLSINSHIQSRPEPEINWQIRSPFSHIVSPSKSNFNHFEEIKSISASQSISFEKQQHSIKIEQTKQIFDTKQGVPQFIVPQKALIIEQKNQKLQIPIIQKQQKQETIPEFSEKLQKQSLKYKQDAPQQMQNDLAETIPPKQQSKRAESMENEAPKEQKFIFDPPSRSYQNEFPFDYPSKLTESVASQSQLEPDSQSQVEIKQSEQNKEKPPSQKESSSSQSDSQQEQANKLSFNQKFGSIKLEHKDSNSQILRDLSETSQRSQKSNEKILQAEQKIKDNLGSRIKRIIDRFVQNLEKETSPHQHH